MYYRELVIHTKRRRRVRTHRIIEPWDVLKAVYCEAAGLELVASEVCARFSELTLQVRGPARTRLRHNGRRLLVYTALVPVHSAYVRVVDLHVVPSGVEPLVGCAGSVEDAAKGTKEARRG